MAHFAQRHQENRILLSDTIVHSLLQRRFLLSDEIVIADDVVDFHGLILLESERVTQSRFFVSFLTWTVRSKRS